MFDVVIVSQLLESDVDFFECRGLKHTCELILLPGAASQLPAGAAP
jgi:hypothetical protein